MPHLRARRPRNPVDLSLVRHPCGGPTPSHDVDRSEALKGMGLHVALAMFGGCRLASEKA